MNLTEEMQTAVTSGAIAPRWLVWISARTMAGDVEAAGFWTGDDEHAFEIDGQTRTYTGAGAMISLGDPTYETGLNVQMQTLTFSLVSQEIKDAVFEYDLRLAPVEIHLALFDPESGALIGVAPAFVGWVEEPQIRDTSTGATLSLTVASSARGGTKTLATKKSPESLRLRNPDDKGRDYSDLSGEIPISWGGEDKRGYFI